MEFGTKAPYYGNDIAMTSLMDSAQKWALPDLAWDLSLRTLHD
jgi:hypothetical protein